MSKWIVTRTWEVEAGSAIEALEVSRNAGIKRAVNVEAVRADTLPTGEDPLAQVRKVANEAVARVLKGLL